MGALGRVAVLGVVACGGGHVSQFGRVPLGDVGMDYKLAVCEYETRCGKSPDVASCLGANLGIEFRVDDATAGAIAAGKVLYDGTKYGQCLDAIATQSCDRTSESARLFPDACHESVVGTVHADGVCALNSECISQQCRITAPCTMACCTGTCYGDTAPIYDVAIGKPCISGPAPITCAAGAYCNDLGVCAALQRSGTTCSGDD